MKVSLIQMNSREDKAANLAAAERLIRAAVAADGPDLVALPEVWPFQGVDAELKRANAEPLPDGEAYRLLHGLACELGVAIHGGSLHERGPEKLFNTTVVFDRDGRELARYRKMHLFDIVTPDGRAYRESSQIEGGREVVAYALAGRTVGCTICYDLRFPELFQALARKGAEVMMVPSSFTLQTGKDHWEVLLRARAIETGSYVVAPAQWGAFADGTRQTYGHSLVVDPWGHVVARASDGEGFVTARLDFDYLAKVREMIPVHRHKVLGA
ncbi:MAG TPA: carbon-nitrogen hydrolase family protein [Azospirillaceae bacterium]|nr:carbon-nitrogen hydrolase family protein [Azospirillaceae bacterium]